MFSDSNKSFINRTWKPLTLSLCVLFVVIATPMYLDLVTDLGHLYPQDDMASDYVKGVLWAIALGISILLCPVTTANKMLLMWGWLGKCVLALFFMLFTENHYGGDSILYFAASRGLTEYTGGYDLIISNVRIMNIAKVFNYLIFDSYHAIKMSFAMIGLVAVYLYYRAAVIYTGCENRKLFYIIAFLPGILFWSSILGKEPVVMLAIALYTYGVVGWHKRRSARYFVFVALGIIAATLIREWLGPVMIIPLLIFVFKGLKGILPKLVISALVLILLLINASALMERFKITAVQDVVSTMEKTSTGLSNEATGSSRQLDLDFSSPAGILAFLPVTTFTALFRPLPGEVMNLFGLLAGLENMLLLFLLWRSVKRTTLSELKDPVLLWAISFVLLWAILNGVVTSANFGVAVRYKLQVLPVMLGILLYLSRKRTIARPICRANK